MNDSSTSPLGVQALTDGSVPLEQRQPDHLIGNQLLELVLESGQLGLWDWNVVTGETRFSDYWAHMLGMDPSEVEPHVRVWEGLMHPEDEARTTEILNAHLRGDTEFYESEHRLKRKGGGWVWVLDRGKVIERDADGKPLRAVGTHTDITLRKEAESLAAEKERQIRTLINIVPEIVWSADSSGRITYANEQWYDFAGKSSDANFQESYLKALHPDDVDKVRDVWTLSEATGNQFNVELRLKSKDGIYRWFLVRGEPARNENGDIEQWFGIATDITERREHEVERENLLQAAESANRSKDDFLAMLSHELRSPLNAIYGWTQILERGGLDEEKVAHAVEVIGRNVRLQKTLIEDLLDVSRIISGKIRLESERFSLVPVVTGSVEAIRPAAEKKAITLNVEIGETLAEVKGDRNRLAQVTNNLLVNALKFTPEKGTITVRLKDGDGCVHLEVSDTGEGISPELLPHVFDLFKKPEYNHKRKFGGMGLGLTLVKHFVGLHGGSCAVDSDGEGKGATFKVDIPYAA